MDALQDLVAEIKRLQLLVCLDSADRTDATLPFTLEEASRQIGISPEECGSIAWELQEVGLIEPAPATVVPGPRALRLTDQGHQRIASFGTGSRSISGQPYA